MGFHWKIVRKWIPYLPASEKSASSKKLIMKKGEFKTIKLQTILSGTGDLVFFFA
jgi:hypothetical protein